MTLPVIPILAAIATSLVGYAALGWIQDRVVSAGPVRRGLLLQLGIALAFVAIGLLLMRSAQVLGLALAAVGPAIGFLAPRALADRRDGAANVVNTGGACIGVRVACCNRYRIGVCKGYDRRRGVRHQINS